MHTPVLRHKELPHGSLVWPGLVRQDICLRVGVFLPLQMMVGGGRDQTPNKPVSCMLLRKLHQDLPNLSMSSLLAVVLQHLSWDQEGRTWLWCVPAILVFFHDLHACVMHQKFPRFFTTCSETPNSNGAFSWSCALKA